MKINSVAILGAGAVGSYLLWGLSSKPGTEVCVIASGERKERFERDGFVINDVTYHPAVKTPEEAAGVDLLIVATKYNSLKGALEDIRTITGENSHTIVMSLMNGVDSEDIIAGAVARKQILYSLIKIASERKENSVRFDPVTTLGIIYGACESGAGAESVAAVSELFSGTELNYRIAENIKSEIWKKFWINISNNQPQAMLGCGVGAYKDSEHAAFLRKKLGDEVEAIAAAKGIDLGLADGASSKGSPVKKRARYSTLQDLDAKRHTEIDMFAGTVVRMGRELGIPTPYNEFTYHMIKALEEKNDGLFDYE